MPKEKLEFIRSKVIEVCPEVMDVRFGTKISELNTGELFHYVGNGMWQSVRNYGIRRNTADFEKGEIVIVLTLSHILRTINTGDDQDWCITPSGMIWDFIQMEPKINWDLTKNLEEQKPEVWDFLYEILK